MREPPRAHHDKPKENLQGNDVFAEAGPDRPALRHRQGQRHHDPQARCGHERRHSQQPRRPRPPLLGVIRVARRVVAVDGRVQEDAVAQPGDDPAEREERALVEAGGEVVEVQAVDHVDGDGDGEVDEEEDIVEEELGVVHVEGWTAARQRRPQCRQCRHWR